MTKPEPEQSDFEKNYFQALTGSTSLTANEVRSLIVDLIADPEKANFNSEITLLVEFIRMALKDTSIPIAWLTGETLTNTQEKVE